MQEDQTTSHKQDNDQADLSDVDFSSVSRIPFYFGPEGKKLFGWLHIVESKPIYDTGVVICPSLGVEYMNAHRPLRYVADYFALAGMPSIRFDYHGTGDSSGQNEDADRLDDWLISIEEAQKELARITGCERFGLIGFRVGAMFASLISEKLKSDFLVLWAPLENGRRYIREVKALQMTGAGQGVRGNEKFLEAAGVVFYPQTESDLAKIDLLELRPAAPRVLIIPRDDLPAKEKLKNTWHDRGLNVQQLNLSGYAKMLVDPHNVIIPHDSIKEVIKWVKEGDHDNLNSLVKINSVPDITTHIRLKHYNSCTNKSAHSADFIEEHVLTYGPDNSRVAILSHPLPPKKVDKRPVVILANSGSNHRVGPNRLYVLIARTLARNGFSCLRIDVDGVGDSVKRKYEDENTVYIQHSSDEIRLAIQSCNNNYAEKSYIVMGLCSGSYFSFHAANDLSDLNIVECFMINPLTFYWEEGMSLDASPTQHFSHWNWYKEALRSSSSWIKLLKGRIAFKLLISALCNRGIIVIKSKIQAWQTVRLDCTKTLKKKSLNHDLLNITSKKTHISLLLARNDPGYDILITSAGRTVKKLLKQGQIEIFFVEDADHTFSQYQPRCIAINKILQQITHRYSS